MAFYPYFVNNLSHIKLFDLHWIHDCIRDILQQRLNITLASYSSVRSDTHVVFIFVSPSLPYAISYSNMCHLIHLARKISYRLVNILLHTTTALSKTQYNIYLRKMIKVYLWYYVYKLQHNYHGYKLVLHCWFCICVCIRLVAEWDVINWSYLKSILRSKWLLLSLSH